MFFAPQNIENYQKLPNLFQLSEQFFSNGRLFFVIFLTFASLNVFFFFWFTKWSHQTHLIESLWMLRQQMLLDKLGSFELLPWERTEPLLFAQFHCILRDEALHFSANMYNISARIIVYSSKLEPFFPESEHLWVKIISLRYFFKNSIPVTFKSWKFHFKMNGVPFFISSNRFNQKPEIPYS